jgi:hypothetical protein
MRAVELSTLVHDDEPFPAHPLWLASTSSSATASSCAPNEVSLTVADLGDPPCLHVTTSTQGEPLGPIIIVYDTACVLHGARARVASRARDAARGTYTYRLYGC